MVRHIRMPALRVLTNADATRSGPEEDLRGRAVRDVAGIRIGTVEELLIDERERVTRLVRVRQTTGRRRYLIPVDAISLIAPEGVRINRTAAHVSASPACPGDPPTDQPCLEAVYAHFGYYPFWAPGHVYPSFPAYPR